MSRNDASILFDLFRFMMALDLNSPSYVWNHYTVADRLELIRVRMDENKMRQIETSFKKRKRRHYVKGF